MKTELQANVLSVNTVKKAMLSCMVYALVQSMTFMVDTIVAGHFLGTNDLIFAVVHKKLRVPLVRLLALKEDDRMAELDVSVPVEAKDVTFISEKLQSFLEENGVAKGPACKTALCMEEIAADYIEHRRKSKKTDKKSYMDIKVFRSGEKVEVVLRNYDEPYNPLVFEQDKESFSKIGISVEQKICRDISYSYAYHLNVVSIVMDSR